jgi:hypothetical protein
MGAPITGGHLANIASIEHRAGNRYRRHFYLFATFYDGT